MKPVGHYWANIYYDLPVQWNGVRPFVGAGIGRSRNSMDPIKWYDPGGFSGKLPGGETTGTAWQVTLAAEIQVGGGWLVEVGYRYADFGEIKKDAGADLEGQFNPSPYTGSATGELRAHELLFTVRREFGGK